MSLNVYLVDPDGEAARAAHQARLRKAALERLARAGRPALREQAARALVALASLLAPSLRITVANPARPAPGFGG